MANPFYKDMAAFISGSGACYQPTHSGRLYTRADFFALAHGDEALARALFEHAAGETPEQLLEGLLQGTNAALHRPLPVGNLDDFRILSDPKGHYYDSQSLDHVLLSGGASLATTLQQMLDGQYGHIGLRSGEPGVLFCKTYRIENEHTTDELAHGYGFLPIEFPEAEPFVCNNSDAGQILLCVWLPAGKLSGERLKQLQAQFA